MGRFLDLVGAISIKVVPVGTFLSTGDPRRFGDVIGIIIIISGVRKENKTNPHRAHIIYPICAHPIGVSKAYGFSWRMGFCGGCY